MLILLVHRQQDFLFLILSIELASNDHIACVGNVSQTQIKQLNFTSIWKWFLLYILTHSYVQAVTNLLNDESISDIDRLRLVMLYALRYEKESPVQLMQLFNKLASRSPKYKPGVIKLSHNCILTS